MEPAGHRLLRRLGHADKDLVHVEILRPAFRLRQAERTQGSIVERPACREVAYLQMHMIDQSSDMILLRHPQSPLSGRNLDQCPLPHPVPSRRPCGLRLLEAAAIRTRTIAAAGEGSWRNRLRY